MPPVSSPERPVAQRAAYSARPTVLVDGQRSEPVMQMLRSCVVREAEGGLSSLSLTLSNWGNVQGRIGHLFNDGALIDFGTRLKLYFGETSAPRAVFEGEVHAIEAHAPMGAPPEITFLAEDKLFAARQARRSALYADMTPADVVQRIASNLGLQPDIDGLDGSSGTWAQLNESDLAFLRRLLARFDADLQLSGDALQVRRSAERERGTINLSMYSQLQQVRVIADLADQVTEVSASGFDVAAGSSYSASSRGAMLGTGAGDSGSSVLQRLHQRQRAPGTAGLPQPGRGTGAGRCRLRPACAPLRARAWQHRRQCRAARGQHRAHRRHRRALRQQLCGDRGHAPLRPDQRLPDRLRRAVGLSGPGLKDTIVERADPNTLLPAATPPVLGPAWAGGVFLAEVSDLLDPDNLGRVQIRLHAANGVADQDLPLWAGVISAGAGSNRGSWWIPDVGDLVVVAFLQGDARFPVVLGGLWHGQSAPPESMDGAGNNYLKVLRSRNGVKVTLDDQDGQEKLILETPGGQKLTLQDGPGQCELIDSNGNSHQARSLGHHRHRVGQGHGQCQHGGSQRRHGDGERRHVEVLRRGAVRHADQQFRRLGVVHARRRQHLVKPMAAVAEKHATRLRGPSPLRAGAPAIVVDVEAEDFVAALGQALKRTRLAALRLAAEPAAGTAAAAGRAARAVPADPPALQPAAAGHALRCLRHAAAGPAQDRLQRLRRAPLGRPRGHRRDARCRGAGRSLRTGSNGCSATASRWAGRVWPTRATSTPTPNPRAGRSHAPATRCSTRNWQRVPRPCRARW